MFRARLVQQYLVTLAETMVNTLLSVQCLMKWLGTDHAKVKIETKLIDLKAQYFPFIILSTAKPRRVL
jgi:hypothetical protein